MPPVNPNADTANLFDETVGNEKSDEPPGNNSSISLEEIDAMEPLQFEDWVLSKLNENGFDVSRTPKSHDHGADGIATSRQSGAMLVIQCKHTQGNSRCDETAIEDLQRAKEAYDGHSAAYVAVTNAPGFSSAALQLASEYGLKLVDRKNLLEWPGSVT